VNQSQGDNSLRGQRIFIFRLVKTPTDRTFRLVKTPTDRTNLFYNHGSYLTNQTQ